VSDTVETIDSIEDGALAASAARLDWPRYLPGVLLLFPMVAVWLTHRSSEMVGWGVSAQVLRDGAWPNLFYHMFAHGSLPHIVMNGCVLISVTAPLTLRMGGSPGSWLRFLGLFFLSGLGGAAMFVAFHPAGIVPMIGASGGISGLIGAAARLTSNPGEIIPLRSEQTRARVRDFVKANLWLLLFISGPVFLFGRGSGVAWESHLGGFLVGLLLGPAFVVSARSDRRAG
jgi:membrane associated rhomboid family serine protease